MVVNLSMCIRAEHIGNVVSKPIDCSPTELRSVHVLELICIPVQPIWAQNSFRRI